MGKNNDLEKFSGLLLKGVTNLFQERGEIKFTKPPATQRRTIIEYDRKMRVDGMEKFNNEQTYGSTVNYYGNAAEMARRHNDANVLTIGARTTGTEMLKKILEKFLRSFESRCGKIRL